MLGEFQVSVSLSKPNFSSNNNIILQQLAAHFSFALKGLKKGREEEAFLSSDTQKY